ncbi:MAG: hypothetical protein IJV56_07410 [Neisseriaceae bacterium]|nr:hypothetical protein [Neisseriaceae bacterium]
MAEKIGISVFHRMKMGKKKDYKRLCRFAKLLLRNDLNGGQKCPPLWIMLAVVG